MALFEVAEPRQQPFRGEGGRHADGQAPVVASILGEPDGMCQLGEALADAGKEGEADGRRHEPPVLAPEQGLPQDGFQLAYLLADGGRSHEQLARRLGEAFMPRCHFEAAQRVQRRQAAERHGAGGAAGARQSASSRFKFYGLGLAYHHRRSPTSRVPRRAGAGAD